MVGQNKISFFVLVSSCPQLYHMNCFFFFFLLTNCLNRLTIGFFFPTTMNCSSTIPLKVTVVWRTTGMFLYHIQTRSVPSNHRENLNGWFFLPTKFYEKKKFPVLLFLWFNQTSIYLYLNSLKVKQWSISFVVLWLLTQLFTPKTLFGH